MLPFVPLPLHSITDMHSEVSAYCPAKFGLYLTDITVPFSGNVSDDLEF